MMTTPAPDLAGELPLNRRFVGGASRMNLGQKP